MAFDFAQAVNQWDSLGLYSHILPFLLIFAVVFGILARMKLFDGKRGVQVIISLVLGLLAIRTQLLGDVLEIVTPRLGVGLVILLVVLILMGLFIPDKKQGVFGLIFAAIGLFIFLIILAQTSEIFGTLSLGGLSSGELISYTLLVILLIGIIVAVVTTSSDKESKNPIEKLGSLFD
jgi:hypothetical protein